MTEIKTDKLASDFDLFKKLTDFSSDVEIKSDNDYQCDVYYDIANKDNIEPYMNDEEFFKLLESDNPKSPSKY